VKYRSVDLAMTSKLRRENEIKEKQKDFVLTLYRLQLYYHIYYVDSTSISMWSACKKKTWHRGLIEDNKSIFLPLQDKCGSSRTIFGAIGGSMHKEELNFSFIYSLTDSTCSGTTKKFYEKLVQESPVPMEQTICILDNHPANHSHMVTGYADET
jgi:hypothetical protein